jgi:hypothetical protein
MKRERSNSKLSPKSRRGFSWCGYYLPEGAASSSRPCASCKAMRGLTVPAFYVLSDGTGRCEACFREERNNVGSNSK